MSLKFKRSGSILHRKYGVNWWWPDGSEVRVHNYNPGWQVTWSLHTVISFPQVIINQYKLASAELSEGFIQGPPMFSLFFVEREVAVRQTPFSASWWCYTLVIPLQSQFYPYIHTEHLPINSLIRAQLTTCILFVFCREGNFSCTYPSVCYFCQSVT